MEKKVEMRNNQKTEENKGEILLKAENLSLSFLRYGKGSERVIIRPVENLSLEVRKAEIFSIVGASGSGKTLLAHAILGILPENSLMEGKLYYKGEELNLAKAKELRGRKIRFIPQSVTYLDPTRKAGKQLEECFEEATKEKIVGLLAEFSLGPEVYNLYPHELSGGMLRRLLFATCMGRSPELIIADEPTPGIHPEALEEILKQFKIFRDKGISVIFITHDMKAAMKISDHIAVFKDGNVKGCYSPAAIKDEISKIDSYSAKLWRAQPGNEFTDAILEGEA